MPSEKTNRIAFQGEPGANSDTACRNMFPGMEPLPCPTFEDAFNAVETGKADLAMIPIENTIAGRVADIHHLLPESKLHIVGEYFLPIHFQLMVLPGVARDEIRTVHSHIHALGQCRKIHPQERLEAGGGRRHGGRGQAGRARGRPHDGRAWRRGLPPSSTASTSSRRTSRTPTPTSRASWCCPGASNGSSGRRPTPTMMTTFIFRVRNVPAALYKAMGGFATNGVNMTKLESYQLGAFSATLFYADIEGHPDDPHVKLARSKELRILFSREDRILGVYRAAIQMRIGRAMAQDVRSCGAGRDEVSVLRGPARLSSRTRGSAASQERSAIAFRIGWASCCRAPPGRWCPGAQHRGRPRRAREPAAVLELVRVGADVVAERLAEAADHQRIGKRPGLAGMVDDAAEPDAGFLEGLAPHRVLDRLARLDEAGERRIHAGQEMRAAPEQAVLAASPRA